MIITDIYRTVLKYRSVFLCMKISGTTELNGNFRNFDDGIKQLGGAGTLGNSFMSRQRVKILIELPPACI